MTSIGHMRNISSPTVHLGNVAEIVMGQAPPGIDCNVDGRGTVFVKAGEFADRFPAVREWTTRPLKLARSGDVLVCVVGATAGKINEAIDCAIGRSVAAVRPSARLVTSYLYHFLSTRVLHLRTKSQGLAQGVITREMLQTLDIPLPSVGEQRRIAGVLDRAKALRAKRRAALAQLDSLTQSIFLDLFGDPASRTRRFPIQPLQSLLRQPLQNGAYYPKESYTDVGGVEMVHMSDAFYEVVPRGNLKRVHCAKSDIKKYALSELDILIARRSLTLEGAAKPCLIPKSNDPLIFESSFIRVTPHPKKMTALYLYHYLGNERVKQKCVQPYITQSTISGINQSNLERVPVIVPPLALQQDFARRVGAVEKLKTTQRASQLALDTLFDTLQHRAFNGELFSEKDRTSLVA